MIQDVMRLFLLLHKVCFTITSSATSPKLAVSTNLAMTDMEHLQIALKSTGIEHRNSVMQPMDDENDFCPKRCLFLNDGLQRLSRFIGKKPEDQHVLAEPDLPCCSIQEEEKFNSEESLWNLLLYIITSYMKDCFLTITYGGEANDSKVLENLLMLPNTRQVVKVSRDTDFSELLWKSQQCRGYIILQQDLEFLHSFADLGDLVWDFQGRYVVIGASKENLQKLFSSKKMKNTESVTGITKSSLKGNWIIYTNWIDFRGQMSRLGTWKVNQFLIKPPVLFPDKLKNFHGLPLKVATFERRPNTFYEWNADGTVKDRYGQEVILATEIAKALNASIEFTDVSLDEKWGDHFPNGSWNGLTGYIQRGDVDIGMCSLYITLRRTVYMQFTSPYTKRASRILVQKSKTRPKWERILYPFEFTTWISVMISLLTSGAILYVLVKAGEFSGGESTDMQSMSFAYLYTTGIHFMEGQAIVPRSRGLQIFISFMWIYAIVITTGYTSNLMALLTVSRSPKPIDTFEQLYHSGKEVYSYGNSIYLKVLNESKSPYMQGLSGRLTTFRKYSKELLEKLKKGEIAVLANEAALMYVVQMNLTSHVESLRFMREAFTSFNVGLATPKGSPVTEKFNDVINSLVQGGFIDYWFKETLKRAKEESKLEEKKRNQRKGEDEKEKEEDKANPEDGAGVQPLSVGHVEGFFYLLMAGIMISSVFFVMEKLVGRIQYT